MKYIEVSVKEATTPQEGKRIITNSFWIVRNGNLLGFYRGRSIPVAPLCNKDEMVTKLLAGKMFPREKVEVKFFGIVYW